MSSDAPTQVVPLAPALAAESRRTWDAAVELPPVPDELRPPTQASVSERVAAMRRRHLLRERRAQEFVADTMNARTGLPIADTRSVVRFVGRLLGDQRLLVAGVVGFNALAAIAGLFVPRLLGQLVDSTVADVQAGRVDAALAGANAAALVVAGLVVVQGVVTFAAKLSATVLGQGVLASAREYVVRAILRLPLSRVESASSGDLVTRVTRDVGTSRLTQGCSAQTALVKVERYDGPVPAINAFDPPRLDDGVAAVDALHYCLLGAGEARNLIRRVPSGARPRYVERSSRRLWDCRTCLRCHDACQVLGRAAALKRVAAGGSLRVRCRVIIDPQIAYVG